VPTPPGPVPSPPPSLLEYLLRATEAVHGSVRRYTSPDEVAFFPDAVPAPLLPPLAYPPALDAPSSAGLNLNDQVLDAYLNVGLPALTAPGDDGNYGSAAVADVAALQALSKRVHYGQFVAEAKFRGDPAGYAALAAAGDAPGIYDRLTDEAVEAAVLARVAAKAATFGADVDPATTTPAGAGGVAGAAAGELADAAPGSKVDPAAVAGLYADVVLPLTKEVQVQYLLARGTGWDGRRSW
jgi:chorismate mutase